MKNGYAELTDIFKENYSIDEPLRFTFSKHIGLHDAEHAMVLISGEGTCLTSSIRGYHRWHCSHDAQLTRGSTTDRKEEIQLYRQVTCGNK